MPLASLSAAALASSMFGNTICLRLPPLRRRVAGAPACVGLLHIGLRDLDGLAMSSRHDSVTMTTLRYSGARNSTLRSSKYFVELLRRWMRECRRPAGIEHDVFDARCSFWKRLNASSAVFGAVNSPLTDPTSAGAACAPLLGEETRLGVAVAAQELSNCARSNWPLMPLKLGFSVIWRAISASLMPSRSAGRVRRSASSAINSRATADRVRARGPDPGGSGGRYCGRAAAAGPDRVGGTDRSRISLPPTLATVDCAESAENVADAPDAEAHGRNQAETTPMTALPSQLAEAL